MSEIDPQLEIAIRDKHDKLRIESDKKYAIKLVERIVFGLVSLILVGVVSAIIALVIKQ